MLKTPVFSLRTSSLIGTRHWYTHLALWRLTSRDIWRLVTFDVFNQAINRPIACCFCIMFKWVRSWSWYSWFYWPVGDIIFATLCVCDSSECQLSYNSKLFKCKKLVNNKKLSINFCVWLIVFKHPGTKIVWTTEPHHEKTCFSPMPTTKVQISLCIRTVWSAPLLFTT